MPPQYNFMKDFRKPNRTKYPELTSYADNQIYEYMIGCGGLYLATKMIRQMNLKKGDIVLDLGCGFGTTSIYLAKNFDITVISVDLWNPPQVLLSRAEKEGISNKIIPLQIDITQTIPFAEEYFDAIFCMNSLFMFGSSLDFLKELLKTLKLGGTICVGGECFNQEPDYKRLDDVPNEYNFEYNWGVWEECFSKYHCPDWWKNLLLKTDMLDIQYCNELDDGVELWDDCALNYYNYFSNVIPLGAMIPQERLVDMILYGRQNPLYTTLYILKGIRKFHDFIG